MSNNTKDDILTAAVELFADYGYHETSMAKIASKANISKGTLYWYFSGKEELFQELITTGFNILFNDVKTILSKDVSPDKMLYKYLESKIRFLEKHKNIAKIAVENMEVISPELKEKAMKKHREIIDIIAGIIDRGIEEEQFRDINSVDTATLIIGMTNCINSGFMFDGIADVGKKVNFIYNFIQNGISKGE